MHKINSFILKIDSSIEEANTKLINFASKTPKITSIHLQLKLMHFTPKTNQNNANLFPM